jgi:RHS repeat-associated protein
VQGRVHIWDSGNIIADIGTETVYYIRVLTLIYAKKCETKTYYRFNGHGDVIALANSSGAIIKRYKYDSFGVEENPGIFDTNVFRYCGEYYDVETKTIYLRARYYDAETGRFTQQDGWSYAVPGFLLSLNLYTYCWNNPVSYIDPSGHFGISLAIKALVGAAINVATTYIAAKATGQEYTWLDAAVAAGVGAVNVIPGVGNYLSGAISGIYAGINSYINGASVGGAILAGATTGALTTFSASNVSGEFIKKTADVELGLAVNAALDLTFGAGNNLISAATYASVIDDEKSTAGKSESTSKQEQNPATKDDTNDNTSKKSLPEENSKPTSSKKQSGSKRLNNTYSCLM